MAVIDLSGTTTYPKVHYIASSGTTQQKITLPPGKLRVSVGSASALYVAWESVSDGAAMPTNKVSVAAANILSFDLGHSASDRADKLAVAAQTGSANIEIILERI